MFTPEVELVRSLVIVCHYTANYINNQLLLKGYTIDDTDPNSWRYYRHIMGLKHPIDEPILIRSLDTLEEIELNKENLKLHPNTRDLYSWGSEYCERVLNQYPEYYTYIKSVVLDVSVANPHKLEQDEIVGWDPNLLEPQEVSLIPRLQKDIRQFRFKWFNPDYILLDKAYLSSVNVTLFSKLPIMASNARMMEARTEETNSQHIRWYLESNGLAAYYPYLTERQRFWLYKNLPYIKTHIGSDKTLGILIENLLDPLKIPLVGYNLTYDSKELLEDLKRKPYFEVVELGATNSSIADRTAAELILIERESARSNKDFEESAVYELERDSKKNVINHVPTKVLESQFLVEDSNVEFSFESMLINYWFYMGLTELYKTYHEVIDPFNNGTLYLSTKQLIPILIYCAARRVGTTLEDIPTIKATEIVPQRKENFDNMYEGYIGDYRLKSAAMDLYGNVRSPYSMSRSGEFYDFVNGQHKRMELSSAHIRMVGDIMSRGKLKTFFRRLVTNFEMQFDESYGEFFQRVNLYATEWSLEDSNLFLEEMLPEVLGYNSNEMVDESKRQSMLLKLLDDFTSYTVQVISKVEVSDVVMLENMPLVSTVDKSIGLGEHNLELHAPHGRHYTIAKSTTDALDDSRVEVLDRSDYSVSTDVLGSGGYSFGDHSVIALEIKTRVTLDRFYRESIADAITVDYYDHDIKPMNHIGDLL